jgi:hypothetical protein
MLVKPLLSNNLRLVAHRFDDSEHVQEIWLALLVDLVSVNTDRYLKGCG